MVNAASVYQVGSDPAANKSGIVPPSHANTVAELGGAGNEITVTSTITGSPSQPFTSVSTAVTVYVPGVDPQVIVIEVPLVALSVPPPLNVQL